MFRFRPGPIIQAAILAAGFIVLRVGYRALFHGLDGSGALLLDLPAVRLPDPFAHVVLFGPITMGGLWAAVVSALPIAAVILAFGVLNACVDVSRLFARGALRGPLRGVSRALVIAWATFPGLADAVRSVRTARRLRGERGIASLLVPVFERTVERAVAVATSMEVRGFAADRRVDGQCAHPVEVHDAALRRADGFHLDIADLRLAPGTLALVTGPTGSGKSTLLDALSGVFSHVDDGLTTGTVRVGDVDRAAVPPRETAGFVGVVLQSPRQGFASETVRAEIGFALDVRGVARAIVGERVHEVAAKVGVAHLLDRDLRALSAGEAVLVAIAAAIIERPTLLLVDEPLADLDGVARRRVRALLDALAHEAGVCVVVAEHRADELAGIADVRVEIADGRVVALAAEASGSPSDAGAAPDRIGASPVIARAGRIDRSRSVPALELASLTVAHGSTEVVHDASLAVAPGEIVALAGANGAGKSSLLVGVALPSTAGAVLVDGRDLASLRDAERRRSAALVPEASDDLFFSLTVDEECRRADRAAGRSPGTTAERFLGSLGLVDGSDDDAAAVARLLASHPRDLSVGQRRLLAIAVQAAAGATVLLVDEPTRGLDASARRLVARALTAVALRGGAVVIATHDHAFAAQVADRVVAMADGRLGADAPPGAAPIAAAAPTLPAAAASVPPAASASPASAAAPAVTEAAAAPTRPRRSPRPGPARSSRRARSHRWTNAVLVAGTVVAALAFAWPFVAPALPSQAQAAAPWVAIALAPFVLALLVVVLDGSVGSAKALAMLGTLAAVGAAVRVAGTGVGGVEAVFVLLILAGRVFGARFGFLLGVLAILVSSTMQGGFGPWTPFQAFACGWVGAGAGLLPRIRRTRTVGATGIAAAGASARSSRRRRVGELALLAGYGVIASYAFGLVMNLWFWPFAIGSGAGISYDADAPFAVNLGSFLLYSLVTSTASWDTLRAITTVVGIAVAGPAVLAALRRVRLGAAPRPVPGAAASVAPVRPRSTSPRGGGTRTRRSTARGAAAAPR